MSVEPRAVRIGGRQEYPSLHVRMDLQGMRAFAVLTVFSQHLFDWPRGGFVGVDVFFVLSGFFITALLIKQHTTTGSISFADFYRRRVRRIIPSAVLVVVATVAGSYLLLTETRAKAALVDGLWATVFASNWRFERVGSDYFAEGQPKSPLLHYWSLSIEEQFYFVWPLALLALFALSRRGSTPSETYGRGRQRWLAGFMVTVCSLSFALACFQSYLDPNGAYFSTFTRVWELGVGAVLAICAPSRRYPAAERSAGTNPIIACTVTLAAASGSWGQTSLPSMLPVWGSPRRVKSPAASVFVSNSRKMARGNGIVVAAFPIG